MSDQDHCHLRIIQSSCESSVNVEDDKQQTKTTQNKTKIKASMIYFKYNNHKIIVNIYDDLLGTR